MTRVLDLQIEAYNKGEAPARAEAPGARRRSVESGIDVGVALFEAAKNEVRRWQQDVSDWDEPRARDPARADDRV